MKHSKQSNTLTHGTLYSYTVGFLLSIILTFIPIGLWDLHVATQHVFPTHEVLYITFAALAVVQLFVQLAFFLHVDREREHRWNLTALVLAGIIVLILVGGTLWIMNNLMQNNMSQSFENGQITPQAELD